MDIYNNDLFQIEKVMKSIPHKFRNATNMKIVLEALMLHKNKVAESIIKLRNSSHLSPDENSGDMLNQCGANWNVERKINWNDEQYRRAISDRIGAYFSSGNIIEIEKALSPIENSVNDIFLGEQFGVDGNGYEERTANVTACVFEDRIDAIEDVRRIISSAKSCGVGAKQFSFPSPIESKLSEKETNFPYDPTFEYYLGVSPSLPNESYFGISKDLIEEYVEFDNEVAFDEQDVWTEIYKLHISDVGFIIKFLQGERYSILPRGDLSTTMSVKCNDREPVRIILQSFEDPLNAEKNYELMTDNFGRTYLIPAINELNDNDIFHSESYKDSIQMFARDDGARVVFNPISSTFITLQSPNKQKWRVYLGLDSRLMCVNTSAGVATRPIISNFYNVADRSELKIDNYGRLYVEPSLEVENLDNYLIQSNTAFEITTNKNRLIIRGVD